MENFTNKITAENKITEIATNWAKANIQKELDEYGCQFSDLYNLDYDTVLKIEIKVLSEGLVSVWEPLEGAWVVLHSIDNKRAV